MIRITRVVILTIIAASIALVGSAPVAQGGRYTKVQAVRCNYGFIKYGFGESLDCDEALQKAIISASQACISNGAYPGFYEVVAHGTVSICYYQIKMCCITSMRPNE